MVQSGRHVGLFFGSFNPVHTGHLIVANGVLQAAGMDEVWFVVSPRSPFKPDAALLPEQMRIEMVRLATADNPALRPCDVEFSLPTPNYTVDTLRTLSLRHPDVRFSLIMGGDNLEGLHLWRESEYILDHYSVWVYLRPGADANAPLANHPSVYLVDMPMIDISSTYIRQRIKSGRDVRYLVPDAVRNYIIDNQIRFA